MYNIHFVLGICLMLFACAAADAADAGEKPGRDEVYELFEVMNLPVELDTTVGALLDAQIGQRPELKPARQILVDFFNRYLSYEALKQPLADLYIAEFTRDDIAAFTAFYRSPAGRKLARNMSRLYLAGGALIGEQLAGHMPELERQLADFHAAAEAAGAEKAGKTEKTGSNGEASVQ